VIGRPQQKDLLDFLTTGGLSLRAACRLMQFNRSTFQYQPRPDHNADLREQLHDFANKKRRRGSVKAWNWLQRQGQKVGRNRVHRVWKQERLQIRKRPGKKYKPPAKRSSLPLVALYPGHVWSYDFLFDATHNGTKLKMLTVGDDFTRECLAIAVATSMPSAKVIEVLASLVAKHSAPRFLRSDNGPEFIAHAVKAWLAGKKTQTYYIDPGSPWQNGFRESFHSRFRDEFLYGTLFASVAESRVLCEGYRREYNEDRPHQSLGYLTPAEFKQKWLQEQSRTTGD
jgi:putative transposase